MEKIVVSTCEKLDSQGRGVITMDGFQVPVPFLCKGETAKISVRPKGKNHFVGEILDLIQPSPFRLRPLCPYFELCGGCQLQHMAYETQLDWKTQKVQNELDKNQLGIAAKFCIGMSHPWKYRNKTQVSYTMDYKGNVFGGFYVEGSHQILNIDQCFIENEEADEIVNFFKTLIIKYGLEPYDRSSNLGSIRHVMVRTSRAKPEIMVVIVTKTQYLPKQDAIVQDLRTAFPKIVSIIQNVNDKPTTAILGEKERVLFGKPYIEDILSGFLFRVSSKSFFQVNPIQTEILYDLAIKSAHLQGNETVLDAYCGIGTLGLIASRVASSVVGVEIIPEAIENAKTNALLNQVTNAQFFLGDAGKYLTTQAENGRHFDVVFVDPPRAGCDAFFLRALLKIKPQKIVYVSCEPETLARDLAILKNSYDIQSVQPVDMFPQTVHVEAVVLLILK